MNACSVPPARAVIAAAALLVGWGFAGTAAAQAPGVDAPVPRVTQEVVVTTTVSEIEGEPLRTVAIVTREELNQLGVGSLVEALRLVPGLDPRARGPRDVQTDLSIRGATFGQSLVLVDGFRLNNSQSGHHNAELPVPPGAIERIEVVYGAGSAVHGADALGGTVNVITRRAPHVSAQMAGGQHGYVAGEVSLSGHVLPSGWTASAWGSRSGGFMFDRDFARGGGMLRGEPAASVTIDVRHQRRAFGANGFYGPSPSKEWTDQTLAGATWRRAGSSWAAAVKGHVRTHHDHFRWDINRPGFAENRHRTDAGEATATLTRELGGGRRATVGVSGGADRIRSSNLGDHDYTRAGVFGELLVPVTSELMTQAGVRVDSYSTFGRSMSPSLAAAFVPVASVRVHAAVSRAFRIPSFTELYYTDPSNLGSPDLRAEHGWSLDAGIDWTSGSWLLSFSPFRRWDTDVIDWTRLLPTDRWRSTNVRDVTTTGFEASGSRRWRASLLRAYYAWLKVDAPELNVLSKYVLEYARHQAGVSVALPLGNEFRLSLNVDHRNRLDGQTYQLVSARLARAFGPTELFINGTNLLNESYHEIAGVDMPGRWITAGVMVR